MACPLGQYHKYEEYLDMMNKKGFTDAEAIALLPQDELAKDMKEDKEHTRLMKAAINSDDANTKKTAIDAITSWGVDSVVELRLS